ncbi:pyridoxal phosphate-dependent aminotransferase [Treponema pedis]|uniref:pyridoxal phosphate-dependent aminotransferase n=1 Tax=Treponema pedis TaxID=409322 RepID=UPI001CEF766C|nr:histidinol-phosphate transaminase [Treponema pedis]
MDIVMTHGGLLSRQPENNSLTDFSSNINPLGMPHGLKAALNGAFQNLKVYPDINYRNLKKAAAKYLNCLPENILLGNGAVEIIDNFCAANFSRVIICPPCFSEYKLRAKIRNKETLEIPYRSDFVLNIEVLNENIKENDLLILGNPNNPTGLRTAQTELLKIYEIINSKKAFLLLDEAFFEFCAIDYNSIDIFKKEEFKNICIIRAATKFFALPGLRLAYACTSPSVAEFISQFEQPWHINAFAEAAAQIIFTDTEFINKSRTYIRAAYSEFFAELNKHGTLGNIKFEPYPSDCNFILLKLLNCTDIQAQNFFEKKGILVRTCSSFKILNDNHIRIAVKSKEDNRKFIETLV